MVNLFLTNGSFLSAWWTWSPVLAPKVGFGFCLIHQMLLNIQIKKKTSQCAHHCIARSTGCGCSEHIEAYMTAEVSVLLIPAVPVCQTHWISELKKIQVEEWESYYILFNLFINWLRSRALYERKLLTGLPLTKY